MKYSNVFLLIAAFLTGCEGEGTMRKRNGVAYLPMETGIYQVYQVSEKQYSVSGDPLELSYEVLAKVVDSFPSANGNFTYIVHRSMRNSEADPWQALDTWSMRLEGGDVIVTEGNIPYVKLKFPLRPENSWNGNLFNSMENDEYVLTGIDQPKEFNGMTFNKTVTVEQEYNEDLIVFRDERKEVYAANVGLVYKEVRQLYYCTADPCLGQQKVDHGVELTMVIKDYGKD